MQHRVPVYTTYTLPLFTGRIKTGVQNDIRAGSRPVYTDRSVYGPLVEQWH